MTEKSGSGEIKGGAGSGGAATTSLIARSLARAYEGQDREVAHIKVERLTEGIYACEVAVHGEPEAERFFYKHPGGISVYG